ncbi:MAG TPA: S9 family peptidase [Bacteroidota bacterium]|nr:S9 family peptidase [Bacteroidota bacterium]
MKQRYRYSVLCALLTLLPPALGAQESNAGATAGSLPLSVAWLCGPGPAEAAATPQLKWLDDGRCLLYDTRRPLQERTLELLIPSTGARTPLVDQGKILAAFRTLLGEEAPRALPFPAEIDGAGKRALYLIGGEILLLDIPSSAVSRLALPRGAQSCVALSPDGNKVSYVRAHDLYVYDPGKGTETRLTSDGSDSLLNGTLSWLYWEEIFDRHDTGYWWSPDSKAIAFLRTDESGVSLQHYVDVEPWTPRVITQRYPKVGERNPSVRLGIASVDGGKAAWVDFSARPYEYIVRVQWLPGGKSLSVQTVNRLQTELDLSFADRATGQLTPVLKETDTDWVNVLDGLRFLRDGKRFLWPSERDGYRHLYMYAMNGTCLGCVTQGNWQIRISGDESIAVDEKEGVVFFTALEKSSMERHLYRARFDGTGLTRLSEGDGTHMVSFSPDGRYYADRYSSASSLPALSIHEALGRKTVLIAGPRPGLLDRFSLRYPAFFTVHARDGFPMPAQILMPEHPAAGKKYPVIMYVYSGPSAPVVLDIWQREIYWENLLLQNGYIVFRCDNRSAAGISKTLETVGARRLEGRAELDDIVDAVRWLKARTFVDSSRIGIWGWSGGGTCTILSMTRSAEFKAGIAVAGVTDFRFYDTKWAEQYMKTENENREGYEENSLLRYAKDLHGRLLLVHGTYDDNVHIQNTWRFADELIRAGRLFELMVYPMRMHGIADEPARVHLYSTMLDFWKRNL